MLNRETLIARIEQELVQAEQAQHDHDFEKHMYAIHIAIIAPITKPNNTILEPDKLFNPSNNK